MLILYKKVTFYLQILNEYITIIYYLTNNYFDFILKKIFNHRRVNLMGNMIGEEFSLRRMQNIYGE